MLLCVVCAIFFLFLLAAFFENHTQLSVFSSKLFTFICSSFTVDGMVSVVVDDDARA